MASVADGMGGDAERCLLPARLGRSRLEGRSPRLCLGFGGVGTGSVIAVLALAAVASSRMLRIRYRATLDRCRAWLDRSGADNFLLVWGGFGAPTKSSIAVEDIWCEL